MYCLEFFPAYLLLLCSYPFLICFAISDNPDIPPCLMLPSTLLLDCMGVLSLLID